MKLNEISIDDIKYRVVKDGNFSTCGFLHQSKKDILSFISSNKYINQLRNEKVSSVICTEDIVDEVVKKRDDIGIIIYYNPRELIFRISDKITPKKFKTIISSTAKISERAIISENNVYIGENCIIEDNVIIKENVILRNNVIVSAGTILGCQGMMLYNSKDEKKIAEHNGILYVDAFTKILNNCVIERAVFKGDVTYIGKNIVLDSGVSISHGCNIKGNTVIAACTKICGYTKIGESSYIGPRVVISNNLRLEDNCNIRIGSTVIDSLAQNADVSSSFAIDHQVNLINRFSTLKQFKNIERKR